jgi:hypothetical protein
MRRIGAHPFLGAIVVASVSVSWSPFHSSLYPYSISQPSSFRHIVLANTASQQVDFFFPSVGSYTTNVNVVAEPGHAKRDEAAFLKGLNGRHIHVSARLRIMGHRRAVTHADFSSLAGNYSIEQVCFVHKGTVWQLTASYQTPYRKMRPMMLRMLKSFRVDS